MADAHDHTGSLCCLGMAETVIAVLIALQFPPGILGHSWMPVQLVLAMCGIAYMALRGADPFRQVSIQPVRYLVLLVVYMFVAHFIVEPETLLAAVRELVIGIVGLVFIGTLVGAARPRQLLVALVLIHALLGASDLLFMAGRLAGMEEMFNMAIIPLKNYLYPAQWSLPFAVVLDQPTQLGGMVVQRAIGIYREPGIYQAFALTAFCAALLVRDLPWRRTLAAIILLGSACTFSTAWLVSLGAIVAWTVISRTDLRRMSSVVSSTVLLLVLAGIAIGGSLIPGFGFDDKLAGESGQDRLRALDALAPSLGTSPWWGLGHGTLQSQDAIASVSGSFVVAISRLGMIGAVLFLGAIAATLFERHDRRSLILIIPLGMTLLTSQPLYYSVAAYFILALPGCEALAPVASQVRVDHLARATPRKPAIAEPDPPADDQDVVEVDEWWDEDIDMPIVILDDFDDLLDEDIDMPIVILDEEWLEDADGLPDMDDEPIVVLDEDWLETTLSEARS